MRTISYNSIRLTLLEFKQRRVALVHGTKMLVLLLLAGFSWQPVVANITTGTRVENPSALVYGKKAQAPPAGVVFYTDAQLIPAIPNPGATEVKGDDQIKYTVHVQNNGTVPITGLRFIDSIPANTDFFAAQYGVLAPTGVAIYPYGTLAAGASISFSFTVTVKNPVPASAAYIRHTSYLDFGDGVLVPVPGESATNPAPVYPAYAINTPADNGLKAVAWKSQEYTPSGANGFVKAGDIVRYIIWVRNTGTLTLTDVVVTDYVPSFTGFVSALGGGTKDINDMVSWTIPSLAPGAQDSMSFFVRVAQDLTGATSIENTAHVDLNNGKLPISTVPVDASGTEPSTNPTTGPSTYIPIKSITSFETWKVGINDNDNNSPTIGPGEDLTYIIYVRNTGNISIPALTINDNIPLGTTFKKVQDGGSYSAGTGSDSKAIFWEVNNIAAGQVAAVHFTVTVDEHLEGLKSITNIAKVNKGDTTLETMGCDPQDPTCTSSKKGFTMLLAGTRADLFISNVVTPNNDGKNDYFVVRGIKEKYRGSSLYVYNRWGNEVYQSKDYQNTWGATGLSEGTYYYILDLNDPATGTVKKYKGWVMIIR